MVEYVSRPDDIGVADFSRNAQRWRDMHDFAHANVVIESQHTIDRRPEKPVRAQQVCTYSACSYDCVILSRARLWLRIASGDVTGHLYCKFRSMKHYGKSLVF